MVGNQILDDDNYFYSYKIHQNLLKIIDHMFKNNINFHLTFYEIYIQRSICKCTPDGFLQT